MPNLAATVCECRYIGPGLPMKAEACEVHESRLYPMKRNSCPNYRPRSAPVTVEKGGVVSRLWPRCVCGGIAQDHD